MAGYRFNLDLFIPQAVYEALSTTQKNAIRDRIRQLKALAVKINAGAANEEATIRAVWHWCYHDESPSRPCGAEQDV